MLENVKCESSDVFQLCEVCLWPYRQVSEVPAQEKEASYYLLGREILTTKSLYLFMP